MKREFKLAVLTTLIGSVLSLSACTSGQNNNSIADGSTTSVKVVPARQLLSVNVIGKGKVISTPAGIDCGVTCSVLFDKGQTIALTASSDSGYKFSGWSGDCTGVDACTLNMDSAHQVVSSFTVVDVAGDNPIPVPGSPDGLPLSALPTIANNGRLINPPGHLVKLQRFTAGAVLTPDGKYLWTIGAQDSSGIRILNAANGTLVQELPLDGHTGFAAFSPNGSTAYVSSTRDRIDVFAVDTNTGFATLATPIALPPDASAIQPDELPPRTPSQQYPLGRTQSFPEGLAITPDGKELVVALNLSDRIGIVDLGTGRLTQVIYRPDSAPGDRGHPQAVAIVGGNAYVTGEGDGTLAMIPLANPSAAVRVRPAYIDTRGINPKKTHPSAIIGSPKGDRLYLALADADTVLELNPSAPSVVLRRFDVGRSDGLGTSPVSLAITSDGRFLFVANAGENAIRVIDLNMPAPAPVDVGALPAAAGEIARIPTALYPSRVLVDEVNGLLHVIALKGVGPGASYGTGLSVQNMIFGALQSVPLPSGNDARIAQFALLSQGGQNTSIPVGYSPTPPQDSPLSDANGLGPSSKIHYVFVVVLENKTFDEMLGDLGLGDGFPCVTLYGEKREIPKLRNGAPCPNVLPYEDYKQQSKDNGVSVAQMDDKTPLTPNFHILARHYGVLNHFYADSETSDDGHMWTSSAIANDYTIRNTQSQDHPFDLTTPVSQPPKGSIFFNLARQNISFFNYGEAVGVGTLPDPRNSADELAIYTKVLANSEFILFYPSSGAIGNDPVTQRTTYDSDPGATLDPTKAVSRMQYFRQKFQLQLTTCANPAIPATCAVPQYNHMVLPNNHTAGTTPGRRTPDAMVRDTDQALGQLVSDISHSKIWPYSAILVMQDDAQDHVDHVDAHRISALVISPWSRTPGTVIQTHYDQMSMLRTAQIILGAKPGYLFDGLAQPMWDAFGNTADNTPYEPYNIPNELLNEANPLNAAMSGVSSKQLWVADAVDEGLVAQIEYAARYGRIDACQRMLVASRDSGSCQMQSITERQERQRRGQAFIDTLKPWANLYLSRPELRFDPAKALQELIKRQDGYSATHSNSP